MTALSEHLLRVAHDKGLQSNAEFARHTGIAKETARRLLGGHVEPDPETLKRVAERLPTSLRTLRELAGLTPEHRPFVAPAWFDDLDDEERRLLIAVARRFRAARAPETVEQGAPEPAMAAVTALNPEDCGPVRKRVVRAARTRSDEH